MHVSTTAKGSCSMQSATRRDAGHGACDSTFRDGFDRTGA
jgi:hypothetical protein